jgi:hypothetical protein
MAQYTLGVSNVGNKLEREEGRVLAHGQCLLPDRSVVPASMWEEARCCWRVVLIPRLTSLYVVMLCALASSECMMCGLRHVHIYSIWPRWLGEGGRQASRQAAAMELYVLSAMLLLTQLPGSEMRGCLAQVVG